MVGIHSSSSSSKSAVDVVMMDGKKPVQVYVRIRPLIQEENGHTEMEYKIIGSTTNTDKTPSAVDVVVDDNDNAENKDNAADAAGGDGITKSVTTSTTFTDDGDNDELHIKIPGKKRTMNPGFQQAHLLQEHQSSSSSSPSAVVVVQQQPQSQPPPKRFQKRLQSRDEWKIFKGIANVIDQNYTNQRVYNKTIQPILLENVLLSLPGINGNDDDDDVNNKTVVDTNQSSSSTTSLCVFTYGHTGSGKSHTLLGYDDNENNFGIYKYAIRDIFQHLESLNDQHSDSSDGDNDAAKEEEQKDRLILLIRITELYKDKIRDLLTGDDCTVRENKHGVANIRGPLIECPENGMIDQKPLGRICTTQKEAIQCIDDACQNRRVGTSTHHDQSSRSHLVIEIEICTQELVEQRNLVVKQETHLTRLMWLQTERMFGKHLHRAMPKWTNEYTSGSMKLRHGITQYENLVKESQIRLKEIESSHSLLLGTTIVFCDLAGNEYAKDSTGSTKEEMEEAATINKSLLAVKEMIRTLNDHSQKHVNFRDSKLSMLLKRHFVQQQQQDGVPTKQQQQQQQQSKGSSKGGRRQQQQKDTAKGSNSGTSTTNTTSHRHHNSYAIMMGHISPSSQYIRKTLNTLTYCQMVGHTNRTNKTGNCGRGGNNTKSKTSVVVSAAAAATTKGNNKNNVSVNMEKAKENQP